MKKFVLSLSVVFCLMFSVFFVGCGEDYSYQDLQTNYQALTEKYDGNLFVNGEINIVYNSEMQNIINTSSNYKLASLKASGSTALFQPALTASFESVSYFLNLRVDYDNVPQDKMNNVYEKFKNVETTMFQFSNSKTRLEEIAKTGGNVENWIDNYLDRFYNAIVSSASFSQEYLNLYEEYIMDAQDIAGRISPAKIQFEFAKKTSEFANIFAKFVLAEYNEKNLTTSPNVSASMLNLFTGVKDNLRSSSFVGLLANETITEAETQILQAWTTQQNYNSIFENNYTQTNSGVNEFGLKTLRLESSEVKPSAKQQACLDKLNEFLNIDCVAMLDYLTDLSTKINAI